MAPLEDQITLAIKFVHRYFTAKGIVLSVLIGLLWRWTALGNQRNWHLGGKQRIFDFYTNPFDLLRSYRIG
jgi:hypothetical protein